MLSRMIVSPLARILMVLLVMPLVSCGAEDYTPVEARNYFDQHKQVFTELVRLISQCEGSGTISIYPDGRVLSTRVLD
jgi:hypothetical protein